MDVCGGRLYKGGSPSLVQNLHRNVRSCLQEGISCFQTLIFHFEIVFSIPRFHTHILCFQSVHGFAFFPILVFMIFIITNTLVWWKRGKYTPCFGNVSSKRCVWRKLHFRISLFHVVVFGKIPHGLVMRWRCDCFLLGVVGW